MRGEDAGDGFAKRGTRVSLEAASRRYASAPDLRGLTLGYLSLKPPATPVIAVTTRRRFIVAQSRSSDDSPVITRDNVRYVIFLLFAIPPRRIM